MAHRNQGSSMSLERCFEAWLNSRGNDVPPGRKSTISTRRKEKSPPICRSILALTNYLLFLPGAEKYISNCVRGVEPHFPPSSSKCTIPRLSRAYQHPNRPWEVIKVLTTIRIFFCPLKLLQTGDSGGIKVNNTTWFFWQSVSVINPENYIWIGSFWRPKKCWCHFKNKPIELYQLKKWPIFMWAPIKKEESK